MPSFYRLDKTEAGAYNQIRRALLQAVDPNMQLTYVSRPGADRAANTRLGKVCKAKLPDIPETAILRESIFSASATTSPPDWDLRRGIRWANRLFMQQRPSASNHTVRAVFCQFLPSREGRFFCRFTGFKSAFSNAFKQTAIYVR